MDYCKNQLVFVVLWWILLCTCCCETEDKCRGNSTNTLMMCSNGGYYGRELFLDTRIFLDTSHFCYCTVSLSGTLFLEPTFMDDLNCGTMLSVQNAVGGTLKQFTCKVEDQISATGSTLYLKMLGIGTLQSCMHLKSEEDFNTTCYVTGHIPPELTTQALPTVTRPTAVTSQSLDVTDNQEDNTSLSNVVNVTDDEVTSSTPSTSTALPLSTSGVDETFILILTACALGFLALLAVVILIVCKCVRHVRTTRQRDREDSSYDITMSPNVQKIAARRLIDLDDELVSAENPIYARHKNGVLLNNRKTEPETGRHSVGQCFTAQQLPAPVSALTEPASNSSEPELKGSRITEGQGITNPSHSSMSVAASTEASCVSSKPEVRRTRSRVGRGITPPPMLPFPNPLSVRETSGHDSNELNYADIDHSEFTLPAKDVVKPEIVEYTTIQVVHRDAAQSVG